MAKATPAAKPPAKVGRPHALTPDEKTLATLQGLAQIHCTTKETACVMRVSEPTLLKFIAEGGPGHETWISGKAEGKASLRRDQFALAKKNAAMGIWLGKQHLEQKDEQVFEHKGYIEVGTDARDRLSHLAIRHAAALDQREDPPTAH